MRMNFNEVAQKIKKRKESRQESGHMKPELFMKPQEKSFVEMK